MNGAVPPNSLLSRAVNRLTRAWTARAVRSRLAAPVATITFDDFPRSAWTRAGPLLEEAGIRASYFVSGSFCERAVDGVEYFCREDLLAVHEAGHEIGCHTFGHQRVSKQSREALGASLDRNAAFVRDVLGDVIMTSFAFPYGDASIPAKRLVSSRFAACRGVWAGVNAGLIDLSQLKAFGLEARVFARYPLKKVIAEAKATNGWLIFFTHDVTDVPTPWGCTPDQLKELIALLTDAGIEILPMKNAIGRVAFT
ncbi:MAG: polysaccharide deacetylase [Mesorhizobium sp.]|nr:MAG: polysaccharide deacetylase [Mesorhizobium sp.]RWP34136.1 MAG: polysaccharide deacetylase [Mesorhizobium sp.]RWP69992.1 MAG: polysaccharide deacetylase [Mesorhizobium sp.]RWQ22674.1 MAG: polysaccharide deacetylase [Mesorhizobium sp.]